MIKSEHLPWHTTLRLEARSINHSTDANDLNVRLLSWEWSAAELWCAWISECLDNNISPLINYNISEIEMDLFLPLVVLPCSQTHLGPWLPSLLREGHLEWINVRTPGAHNSIPTNSKEMKDRIYVSKINKQVQPIRDTRPKGSP